MRTAILIVLAATLLVGGYLWQNRSVESPVTEGRGEQTYTNETYGISFTYPGTYVLEERDVGNSERWHHVITLMDREAAANIPQNGEGPTAITIDFIQNDINTLSIGDWVANDSRSNFKLSPDGELIHTTIAGKEALTYTWDGLYRGQSIVFAHKNAIVMISVTHLSLSDQIRVDFSNFLSSLRLQ